jgi:integrase
MKDRKEFKCALSDDAVELLEGMEKLDDFVFVGGSLKSLGKPLSDAGMSSVLKRMDVSNATVHGFRSTFRDYIGEETDLDYRLAEMALAHTIGSQSERAYARGDLLKKRFSMMNIWADYLRGA